MPSTRSLQKQKKRITPQPSMDELSSSSSSSSLSMDGLTKPLIFPSEESALTDHHNNKNKNNNHSNNPKSNQKNKGNLNNNRDKRTYMSSSLSSSATEGTTKTTTTTTTTTKTTEAGPEEVVVDESEFMFETARMQHDYFNLVALLIVIASAAIDWNLPLLFQGLGSLAYKGDFFWVTWVTVFSYFLIDLLWVTRIPHCVKSPQTIVQHHLVVLCYVCAPIFWPEYRWFMGALLSVEINTWFLILRRVVYKKKIVFLANVVSFSFYFSWIVIRCGIYPAILIHFFCLAAIIIRETGQFWHWPMIFIPVHFVLCWLNLKWSWDLFYPIVKSWFVPLEKNENRKPPGVVSSGL